MSCDLRCPARRHPSLEKSFSSGWLFVQFCSLRRKRVERHTVGRQGSASVLLCSCVKLSDCGHHHHHLQLSSLGVILPAGWSADVVSVVIRLYISVTLSSVLPLWLPPTSHNSGETFENPAEDHQTLLPRNLWRFEETCQLFQCLDVVKWSENAKYAGYLGCYRETLVSIVTAS